MNEILDYLRKREGAEEPSLVTTYRLYLHGQEVIVELSDHGAVAGSLRYNAVAYWRGTDRETAQPNENGYTTGNPDSTAEDALSNLHWWVFNPQD